jgi:hypothetical protein
MTISKQIVGISGNTPRTLSTFKDIFWQFIKSCSESVQNSALQKSMIADTIIWYLEDDGYAGKLPFTYGEAYLSVGIPKEFLCT